MENRMRSRKDLIQNLLITLLALSAVILFAQSQLYSLGLSAGSDYLSRLTGEPSPADRTLLPSRSPIVTPVRVVVSSTYGRYGNVSLTTDDQEFEPLGTLLSEVLGSARTLIPSSEQAFLSALQGGSSVYYDFGNALPVPILAELMGLSQAESPAASARRLVVSDRSGEVSLYLWDNEAIYLQCTTAVPAETLQATVNRYELGGAAFAMDEPLPGSETLSPLSLFLDDPDPLALPVLSAVSSISGMDRILSSLNFNPRTNQRYLEPDGTEVIVEGERTIRISSSGLIQYQSGGEDILALTAAGQTPSLQEAAADVSVLLSAMLGDEAAPTALYLSSAQQDQDTTVLQFDYHIDGVPVYFSDGTPAARVILRGGAVDQLILRFRQYTATAQPSLLLPLEQAMAVAALRDRAELSIGYEDRGSETVSAQWLDV